MYYNVEILVHRKILQEKSMEEVTHHQANEKKNGNSAVEMSRDELIIGMKGKSFGDEFNLFSITIQDKSSVKGHAARICNRRQMLWRGAEGRDRYERWKTDMARRCGGEGERARESERTHNRQNRW